MQFVRKYGASAKIRIPVVKAGASDFAVGADWTPATGDVKISKDGGAAANITTLPTAIAMGNGAIWEFSISATEMQAAEITVTVVDAATKAVQDQALSIITFGNASAGVQVDWSDAVRLGLTALPNAAAGANGGLPTGDASGHVALQADQAVNVTKVNGTAQTARDLGAQLDAAVSSRMATFTVPTHFDVLGISAGGHISNVDTLTTYTGDTPQTGDAYARIGAAGAGLTALGDTRIGHLDADVSSRLPTSSYTAPDNSDIATILSDVSAGTSTIYGLVTAVKNKTDNLPASPAATSDIPSAATVASAVWNDLTSALTTAGSIGSLLVTNMDAAVSSRMATFTVPAHFDVLSITAGGHISNVDTLTTYTGNTPQTGDAYGRIGAAGAGLTALGDTRIAHLDADVSSRLPTSSYVAPDNTDIATILNDLSAGTLTIYGLVGAIKNKTDNLPASPAATSDIPSAATVASAVWNDLTSALTTNGSIGKLLVTNVDTTISSRLDGSSYTAPLNAAGTRAAVGLASANLDAQLGAIAGYIDTEVGTIVTAVGAIQERTDNLPDAPAAVSDIPTADQNADALLDRVDGVEANMTLRDAQRLQLAALVGKASGLATNTAVFRDTNDTKNRIIAVVDADGDRTAMTLDAS